MKAMTRTDCEPCDNGVFERPRYFARQVITAGDMTLEQQYFRDKLRRHNVYLHGWGVVCGAIVCPVPAKAGSANGGSNGNGAAGATTSGHVHAAANATNGAATNGAASPSPFGGDCGAITATTATEPWILRITPGYILGPFGDEIMIDCERHVDIRTGGVVSLCGEPPGQVTDPWCTTTYVAPDIDAPQELWVAVKYKEFPTRPVRVQPLGCGCGDNPCEHTRLCDGYEIGFLPKCPESHKSSEKNPSLNDLLKSGASGFLGQPVPACPPCATDPWVVLAKVVVDKDGKITSVDNCSCRRMVVSLARAWWECGKGVEGGGSTPGTSPGTEPPGQPGPSTPPPGGSGECTIRVLKIETRLGGVTATTTVSDLSDTIKIDPDIHSKLELTIYGTGLVCDPEDEAELPSVATASKVLLVREVSVEPKGDPQKVLVVLENAEKKEGTFQLQIGNSRGSGWRREGLIQFTRKT